MRPPLLIALLIILLTLAAAGAHLQETDADLSRFNSGWAGTAAFYSLAGSMGASVHAPGTDAPDFAARYIIIAPEDAGAGEYVQQVLGSGGTVIIADEEGGANRLLEAVGSGMRIVPANVSSVDMEFASPRTIIATVKTNHTLFSGVETLVFNRPSYISGGEPMVRTSVLSWIDPTGTGSRAGASLNRYTLIAREEVGEGELILIADASLFATTMQQVRRLHDNPKFLTNLLGSDDPVVIDAVHGRPADAEGPAYYVHMIKSAPISTIIAILLLMITIIAAFRRKIL